MSFLVYSSMDSKGKMLYDATYYLIARTYEKNTIRRG